MSRSIPYKNTLQCWFGSCLRCSKWLLQSRTQKRRLGETPRQRVQGDTHPSRQREKQISPHHFDGTTCPEKFCVRGEKDDVFVVSFTVAKLWQMILWLLVKRRSSIKRRAIYGRQKRTYSSFAACVVCCVLCAVSVCRVSCVVCRVSRVVCRVSRVACRVSRVACVAAEPWWRGSSCRVADIVAEMLRNIKRTTNLGQMHRGQKH